METDGTELTQQVPASEDVQDESARSRRWWWVVVLLLLLLLSCGLLAQALFPTRRGTAGKKEVYGVTAVFSIYGLHQPLGVSSGPNGEILVSDTGVQKVLLFNQSGDFVRRIGGESVNDKVFSVLGSTWVGDTVYVCDWNLKRVWIFRKDGKVLGHFPDDPTKPVYGDGGFTPYGIARLQQDFLVATRSGVFRFDSAGRLKGRFDKTTGLEYGPQFMDAITVDERAGRVYVCDTLNRRVIAYDSDGRPVWVLGKRDENGEIKSFFGLPRGIAVTDKGILVSDTFRHMLVLLSTDGKPLGSYCRRGVIDGAVNFPEGLGVAPDGMVYLADRENNRVQVLKLGEPERLDPTFEAKWKSNFKTIAR